MIGGLGVTIYFRISTMVKREKKKRKRENEKGRGKKAVRWDLWKFLLNRSTGSRPLGFLLS